MLKTKKPVKRLFVAPLACFLGCAMAFSGMAPTVANAASEVKKNTYYPDFASYEDEQESAAELNLKIAEEGMILLKNKTHREDGKDVGALPLKSNERKITVFGKASTNLLYGGSGSGSGSGDYVTLQESLDKAGFKVNPLVTQLYSNAPQENLAGVVFGNSYGSAFVRESDPDSVLATASGSYQLYNDAAIVVLARSGGEGSDLPKFAVDGHTDQTEHYLELDDNEKKTIEIAKANFDKVIIVINSSNALELGGLENDDEIDGIIWIGAPGTNGILALGEILNGSVNPSGSTVDIFPADFTKDPTWYNTGDNAQTHLVLNSDGKTIKGYEVEGRTDYTTVQTPDGKIPVFNSHEYYTITYKEGIYLGYKYYETVADIIGGDNGEAWYQNAVVYPFGYGLSYTTFGMEMSDITDNASRQTISFDVTVTNTGDVAGKKTVQIYSNPPYTDGGIEKATANFIDFGKTDLLQPGKSQTLHFELDYEEFASFDADGLNAGTHKGYELEAGDYVISVNSNSHDVEAQRVWTVDEQVDFDDAGVLFSNGDEFDTTREASLHLQGTNTTLTGTKMDELTRKAGTSLSLVTDGAATDVSVLKTDVTKDLTFSEEAIAYLNGEEDIYAYEDAGKKWEKTAQDIAGWSQAGQRPDGLDQTAIQLWEMNGEEYGNEKWVQFMNQLTYYEMVELLSEGHYYSLANDRIGKPYISDQDGPAQLKGIELKGYFWCSASVISQTYNKELAYEQGVHVGNESILTDTNGWYGPSMNIHRSPFSGRNFEYYSQDAKQGGLMAAQVVAGARSKGTHTFIKHFALNDQETHRHGIMTWVNEQAARENYFRNFELAVTEGGANGTMCSFGRIGINPASNYAVYIQMLEDEWGFHGISVTDGNGNGSTAYGWNGNNDARAHVFPLSYGYKGIKEPETVTGNNMEGYYDKTTNMLYIPDETQAKEGTAALDANGNRVWTTEGITQWYWVRTSAMNMLYVAANGNAMDNGINVSSFADKTVNLTQAVNADLDLSDGLQGTVFNFEVSDGKLPDGVTLSALGKLSGRPTVSGTYTADITVTVDNYIKRTATYTFNVGSVFSSEVNGSPVNTEITLVKGTSYQGAINFKVTDATLTAMGYDFTGHGSFAADTHEYSVTSKNLPEGMDAEATENGIEIFGTPATGGTYEITVRLAWGDKDGFKGRREQVFYYSETYLITIPEVSRTVTVNYNCSDISNSTVSVGDGENVLLATPTRVGYIFTGWYADADCTVAYDMNKAVTADTTVYAGWTQITDSSDTVDLSDITDRLTALENANQNQEKSGCSGSMTAVSVIGLSATLGTIALVVAFINRKKYNDK